MADAPHADENTTDTELDRAVADILTEMRTADPARATELGKCLVELLDRRNAADATRTAELGAVATGIDRAVRALDDAASSAELMQRACERVAELCSARAVVLSLLDGDRIVPATWFGADPGTMPSPPSAFDLVDGSPEAQSLATNTVEIGADTPAALRELLGTNGVTVLPIVVGGAAAALMHLNTSVDDTLRHALGVFAEVLGGCFERVGLESRRERQNVLLQESARRWTDDTDLDAPPPRGTYEVAPAQADRDAAEQRLLDPLTDREADVVRLLLTGASNSTIATELVITVDTVKSHVKRILRKLGATNRAELIAKYQSPTR
ncbi:MULTISPECIES: LuxR C-terminal-related transcriptional regulator [unclassified Rhodococcus (in: high G+C Gram-positive bacteria)]|uniref:helix-turn-helix transcriptional regulator n=1 Tax=unclassified Rhodococcus (in: high G+C Gram-positive bacteria) TaxID=192944 RepID=UPI002897D357|nr:MULTISPECIES: LuxR C-terminal-related transcriptional regulator [unclassified Rhodococcus (in: high G+C Gram-positive bacteria)]